MANKKSQGERLHILIDTKYTRIDYLFLSPDIFEFITKTNILPIAILDHSPVVCSFILQPKLVRAKRWRFKSYLLQNEDFIKQLRPRLTEFLQLNSNSSSNPQVLWEVTKCFLRGDSMAFASHINSTRNKHIGIRD